MKFKAELAAWSGIVGGGVHVMGSDGRTIGQIAFVCHRDEMRRKDVQMELSRIICDAINSEATE